MHDRSLPRGTDRVEDAAAWLLTVFGIILVIVAGVLGLGTYSQGMERVRSDQAERVQATAVVLTDAPDRITEPDSAKPFVRVPARWTDAAGVLHEGEVTALSGSRAGAQVQVWLDHQGELAGPPSTELDPVLDGLVTVVGVFALGGCAIVAIWRDCVG